MQNDFFFLSKKEVPENRHEKQRELPDYYLKYESSKQYTLST